MSDISIPPDLQSAIQSDKLIIFAGAGLSHNFNLPDWKHLVKAMIQATDVDNKELLIQSLDVFSPLEVLEKIKQYKVEICQTLENKLQISSESNFDLVNKLFNLSSKIITTNYDKAFEIAIPGIYTIPYNNNFKISQLQDKNQYLFKIHGTLDDPENCILTKDQYEDLYKRDSSSSIFELSKIVSEKTILFIGFSMSDPYVKSIFEFIDKIYHGFSKKHYVITSDLTLEDRLGMPNVKSLLVKDYKTSLNELVEKLYLHKRINTQRDIIDQSNTNLISSSESPKSIIKICILKASPIDKDVHYNLEEIINKFSRFQVEVSFEFLSLEFLRNLLDYDYLIILTHNVKNKILIEDHFLKSKFITLKEIEENVDNNRLKLISVFYTGDENLEADNVTAPFLLINSDKGKFIDIFNNFVYKIFQKSDINSIPEKEKRNLTLLEKLPRGNYAKNIYQPNISKYIDRKQLLKFVGRKTDLENISRKILENQYINKLLTIKGSGGIGKTTIITKVAIELATRRHFDNGIYFISCQAIQTAENFNYHISQCFGLVSSIELESQITDLVQDRNRLIILDNFETVLNIKEREEVLALVSFILDYATVVVTSRQILRLDFEDVYELRNFTTDEGVALFKSYYSNIKESEEKVLREQIVEKILNNNPLAIKLIAKGVVASKSMYTLKEELEENLFKDENIEEIFERPEDYNIEKSDSLYQSINYSYLGLTEKEKLTFELLSLFPDGIHLENFKNFLRRSSSNNKLLIGEKEIKKLDEKSLLENSNAFLKLQSIISRFAEYQFKKRNDVIKKEYYTIAFGYNTFLINVLNSGDIEKNFALKVHDDNVNNYLKILDNIDLIEIEKVKKLFFFDDVIFLFKVINQQNAMYKRHDSLQHYFSDVEGAKLYLDCAYINLEYWTEEFKETYTRLKKILPLQKLVNGFITDELSKKVAYKAILLYECEGFQNEILNIAIASPEYKLSITSILFQLGYLKEAKIYSAKYKNYGLEFFDYEIKNAFKELKIKELDDYISKCHSKNSLEIVQSTYLKLRSFDNVSSNEIKKLVVTNPYTKGLIKLMYALTDESEEKAEILFKEAIGLLEHIKYYHTEAIYLYCCYLKKHSKKLDNWLTKGLNLSRLHHYRYLHYKFLKIQDNDYDDEYEIENFDYDPEQHTLVTAYVKSKRT